MPTIHAADPPYTGVPTTSPQFVPTPEFQIRATPDMFGAQVGQAVSRLGETIGQAGEIFARNAIAKQELFNSVAADDATNKYQEGENKILYGDPNDPNDHGFMGLSGEDAMRAAPKVHQDLANLRAQIHGGLQNQRQQLAFDSETRRMQSFAFQRIGSHYDSQFKEYAKATNAASTDLALRDIAAHPDDPAVVADATRKLMESGYKTLQINGTTEDVHVWDMQSKVQAAAYAARVQALAHDNPTRAKEILQEGYDKGILRGEVYDKLEGQVNHQSTVQQDNDLAATIWGNITGQPTPGGTRRSGAGSSPSGAAVIPKGWQPAAYPNAPSESQQEISHPERNNPGNLRVGDNPWVGKTTKPGEAFESFDKIENGVRARAITYGSYLNSGTNTITAIANRSGPASDNNDIPSQVAAYKQALGGQYAGPGGENLPIPNTPENIRRLTAGGISIEAGGGGKWLPKGVGMPVIDRTLKAMGDEPSSTTAATGGSHSETLANTVQKVASSALPSGYTVEITSADRPHARVEGTGGVSQHALHNAIDFKIFDADHNPIDNTGPDKTGLYGKVAVAVRGALPDELKPQLAWGGNFTTGPEGGPRDLMHLDLGGDRGRYGTLAAMASKTAAAGPSGAIGPQGPAGSSSPIITDEPPGPKQAPASPDKPAPHFPTREEVLSQIPEGLTPERYNSIYAKLNQMYTHQLQVTSADRARLIQSLKGGLEMLQDGRDYQWDEKEIRRLIPGADEEQRVIDQLNDAKTVGQQIQAVRGMSQLDILRQQTANRDVLSRATGDEYLKQKKLSDAFDKAAAQHVKALGEDPAAYVGATNPEVERLRQAIDPKDPKSFETYATALVSEEKRLGVHDEGTHVLGTQNAKDLTRDIMSDPESAPTKMNAMKQQYGDAYPAIYRDLVTLGKLPAGFQAIGMLENERDGALLARGLAEQGKSNKTWDEILGNQFVHDTQNDVRTDTDIGKLTQSLQRSGADTGQIAGVLNAIDTLTFAKKFYDGDADAAKHAKASFLAQYEFMPNGGARVPAKQYDAVKANAANAIEDLDGSKIAVPPAFSTGKPGAPTQDDFLRTLKATPMWITSPKADALWLMDPQGRLVRGKDGTPLAVPFDQPMPAERPANAVPPSAAAPF